MMLIELLPLEDRDVSANQVVDRLRGKLQSVPGARLLLTPQQDIFVGGGLGRAGAQQLTLLASDFEVLKEWQPRVQQAMASLPELVDVDTDSDDQGQRIELSIDREDRKSTRLNSSHVAISYAVFCLKKKIKNLYKKPLISEQRI